MTPNIPKYSRLSAKFWNDERASQWPDQMKLAALYFLSCRHRTLEGLFLLPAQYAAADLGWSVKRVNQALAFLEQEQFLRFDRQISLLLLRNALKYQRPESSNVCKGAIRRILGLPKSPLIHEFVELARRHSAGEDMATAFVNELARLLERASEHPSEQALPRVSELLDQRPSFLKEKQKPESKTTPEGEAPEVCKGRDSKRAGGNGFAHVEAAIARLGRRGPDCS